MSKPLIILDVDDTLVHATEKPLADRTPDHQVGPYAVYRRPHLSTFLEAIAGPYDLAVWSSASSDYVSQVVSAVFPDISHLKFIWASDRCTPRYHEELQERFYAKNLKKVRRLGYPLERVLMIDDSPEKVSQHYGNYVRIQPFTGDMSDDEFVKLLPFLTHMATVENLRKVEKRNWRRFGTAVGAAK